MNDYIKRGYAKTAICSSCANPCSLVEKANSPCVTIIELARIPSADVAPVRRGHWELNTDMTMHCSCCGELFRFDDKDECLDFMECAKYCIACGAKMDEVKDAE